MAGTFLPNLGTLGLWDLELFAMYVTDGRTDGRTDNKSKSLLVIKITDLYSAFRSEDTEARDAAQED